MKTRSSDRGARSDHAGSPDRSSPKISDRADADKNPVDEDARQVEREANIAVMLKEPGAAKAVQDVMGAAIYRQMICAAFDDPDKLAQRTGDDYAADAIKRMAPRDALEELLIMQSLWLHARMARLSVLALNQTNTKNLQVLNEACDRAANAYRRHMLALAEYRRPPRQDSFAIIKQANLANQQVVNNVETPSSEKQKPSNEQGLSSPAQLPAYEVGTGIPTSIHDQERAMAEEYRTQDTCGKEPLQVQRTEARRTERR